MATDITETAAAKAAPWDVDAFKSHFANLSLDDKRLVLYWLVHDLCGDRPEKETDVSDPEGFLYMHFVPPGLASIFGCCNTRKSGRCWTRRPRDRSFHTNQCGRNSASPKKTSNNNTGSRKSRE